MKIIVHSVEIRIWSAKIKFSHSRVLSKLCVVLLFCSLLIIGCSKEQTDSKPKTALIYENPKPPPPPLPKVTIAAVGDVMLDRGVAGWMAKKGITYPFEQTSSILAEADIAFCNLEGPISTKGVKIRKTYSFKAKPEVIEGLKYAGFDIVSLANNHTLDYGRVGLIETMEILTANKIHFTGAGKRMSEAKSPTIIERNGIKAAFVAYADFLPEGAFLKKNAPSISHASVETLPQEVNSAKEQGDVVVVSFHWGAEYANYPSSRQRSLAHQAVDAGASLVIGHHPHVLQGLEVYKGSLIAYSLGNFIFDQRERIGKESILLQCELNRRGISKATIVPIVINRCQPQIATEQEGNNILRKAANLSKIFKTQITIDSNRAIIEF